MIGEVRDWRLMVVEVRLRLVFHEGRQREVAEDGEVTLFGSVRTYLERDKAEQAAWSLPGVTQVDNLLLINP